MKKFLLITLCLCGMFCNAQTIKKVNSTSSVSVTKEPTDEELAINKSQAWFKENYVESQFMDPYSYRVVGIKATPVTRREFIDRKVEELKLSMSKCSVRDEDCTEKGLIYLEEKIAEYNKKIEYYKKYSSNEFDQKKLRMYAGLKQDCLKYTVEIKRYMLDKEELTDLFSSRLTMTDEQLDSLAYYDIHLDCYSKNEIGNEVLGRFVFPFTKDGVFINNIVTLNMVRKVN